MKSLALVVYVLLGCVALPAQHTVWQPSPGHVQVPIWPGTIPDAQPASGPEAAETASGKDAVAGRRWLALERVTVPTMTVYAPQGKNTRAAVVVFPGGGYQILAIDLEGTEVCDWLTSRGITCILLKYRVPCEPSATDKRFGTCRSGPYPESPLALEDAQRTLRLVRYHASAWHIDPGKIGVLGFSAGGHLVAATSTLYGRRLYAPTDAADRLSCRPDFGIAIYPGHLTLSAAEWDASRGPKRQILPPSPHPLGELTLNPEVPVTSQTPPTFLLQNEDDHVDGLLRRSQERWCPRGDAPLRTGRPCLRSASHKAPRHRLAAARRYLAGHYRHAPSLSSRCHRWHPRLAAPRARAYPSDRNGDRTRCDA